MRCLVDDPRASELAERWETTRSAAAVSLWGERLAGAVVAIGNAPTALFHLLELIADGAPRPAAIIGTPVGFVGSAESKIALAKNPWGIPSLVVHGRRGGSALCAAAVNTGAGGRALMTGRLYGVGVGPGDPELITLKAATLIKNADVIAYHSGTAGRSIARSIADSLISDNAIEELLIYPVTTGSTDHPLGYYGAVDDFYDESAERLSKHLDGPDCRRPR